MAIIEFPILYAPDPVKGRPLGNGQIFVGEPDLDPQVPANQKQLRVVQEDGTKVDVSQPFVVSFGGVPTYNGSTVRLDVDGNYSFKMLDKLGAQKYYVENVLSGTPVTNEDLINDLSQAYEFPTRQLMIDSAIAFPVGKLLYVINTNADYIVTAGSSPNIGSPSLTGGGYAELQIYNKTVTLLQLGAAEDAKGDGIESGTTDDSAVVDYASTLGINVIVSNKCMISTSRSPVSNSKFYGALDAKTSQFIIKPGVEVNNPFEVTDVSNVSFNKLGFIGNSTASVPTQAGAIRFRAVSALMQNLEVTECYFENFKQNYWIYARNDSSIEMSNVHVDNNEFVSMAGNDIDPSSMGVPACCIAFQGSVSNKTGIVTKITANQNRMNCSFMKSGIFVWSNCQGGEIKGNDIKDCGASGSDDKINYAIALYTNRYLFAATDYDYDPSGFEISGNELARARDCGIYLQGLVESTVHDNNIYGQTSTADATLLKGGIVTNGVHLVDIYSNTLYDNEFDFGIAQINFKPDREIICNIYNNNCQSRTSQCVKIVPNAKASGTQSGLKSTLNLTDNEIRGAVQFRVSDVADNFELNITGGSIKESGSGVGFFLFNAATPTIVEGMWINIVDVDFADLTQDGINITVDYTSTLIKDCSFDMGSIDNKGIAIQNSKGVTWIDNYFWASETPTAGDHCVNLTSAEHFSKGNYTRNIGVGNKEIGFVAPTWAANEGDKVQTLRASEAGVALSKYITTHYIYSGNTSAWVEERILTGN